VFWTLVGLCVAALVGGVVTAGITARNFTVPSTSMANTIEPGDAVVVDRTAQVHRGDVIVEQQPSTGNPSGYFIRRVIGLPGDHVDCCDSHGRITVNGKPLDESYLYPSDAPSLIPFNITVPAGKLWLLGDHRSMALDSRAEGPLAVQVVGRVILVLRSGHAIFLHTPRTFIADGLAPASNPVPPAFIGAWVFVLALVLLVALIIFGIVRYAMRRRPSQPHPADFPPGWRPEERSGPAMPKA
jgi:signal peptidase I